MTNSELKNKISESINPDWFNEVTETINFHYINYTKSFKGISALFEFINQQIKGWEKLKHLPNELNQSLNYYKRINEGIITFMNAYSQNDSNRNHYWQQYVTNRINNVNQKPLLYNLPEVDFLVKISKDHPNYFSGAWNVLINKQINNLSQIDSLFGAILDYEFLSKDFTALLERRNSEKRSILLIRNDFEKYLNESEVVLTKKLINTTTNIYEYTKTIYELKNEKQNEFVTWFDNVKSNE